MPYDIVLSVYDLYRENWRFRDWVSRSNTDRFCMATVFIWSISGPLFCGFNLYVTGKRNVLPLLSVIFVLCNRVQSSKITSYFELFWTKYFNFGWQNVSTFFSPFFKTDWQFFTYLLNINIMETWTEGIKSSYYEEFRIFKLKLA